MIFNNEITVDYNDNYVYEVKYKDQLLTIPNGFPHHANFIKRSLLEKALQLKVVNGSTIVRIAEDTAWYVELEYPYKLITSELSQEKLILIRKYPKLVQDIYYAQLNELHDKLFSNALNHRIANNLTGSNIVDDEEFATYRILILRHLYPLLLSGRSVKDVLSIPDERELTTT